MCKALKELKDFILSEENPPSHIGLVLHENPDPDCIGSAMGMRRLLQEWNPDITCTLLYSGEISHSQNKTLVNVLNVNLVHMSEIDNLSEYADEFIVMDSLPERSLPDSKVKCLMCIDHHRVDTKKAKIVDIRNVGATSSIVWDYFQKSDLKLDKNDDTDQIVATALLVGIKTDTSDCISENTVDLDHRAYQDLMGYIDRSKLVAILNYPISHYIFEIRSELDKEENVRIDNGVFVGGIGIISGSLS